MNKSSVSSLFIIIIWVESGVAIVWASKSTMEVNTYLQKPKYWLIPGLDNRLFLTEASTIIISSPNIMKHFTAKGKPNSSELPGCVIAIGYLNFAPKAELSEFTVRNAGVGFNKRNLKY